MAAPSTQKVRSKRMTPAQIEGMVDAICKDISLHTQTYTSFSGKEEIRHKWTALAAVLNKSGPPKDWKGYRQAWFDLRNRTSMRLRDISRDGKRSVAIKPLTPLEMKVLEVVRLGNPVAVEAEEGQANISSTSTESLSRSPVLFVPFQRSPSPEETSTHHRRTPTITRGSRRRGEHPTTLRSSAITNRMDDMNDAMMLIARNIGVMAEAMNSVAKSIALVAAKFPDKS